MLGRRTPPPLDAPDWHGSSLTAHAERRRRGLATSVHVDLATGDTRATMAAVDLVALVDGRIGIAESVTPPLAFLCTPASAAADSAIAPVLAGVDPAALALVAEPMERVAVTLAGDELAAFSAWVRALPR